VLDPKPISVPPATVPETQSARGQHKNKNQQARDTAGDTARG
jgi:hypothetical protein